MTSKQLALRAGRRRLTAHPPTGYAPRGTFKRRQPSARAFFRGRHAVSTSWGRRARDIADWSRLTWECHSSTEPATTPNPPRLIAAALETGGNFIGTSDAYGDGHNERLIGRAPRARQPHVVLAAKSGVRYRGSSFELGGRLQYAPRACPASLRRLPVDHIDLISHPSRPPTPPGGRGHPGDGAARC